MAATESSQRVPAWKRLGLQLKSTAAPSDSFPAAPAKAKAKASAGVPNGGGRPGSSFSSKSGAGGPLAKQKGPNVSALGKRKHPDTHASGSTARNNSRGDHTGGRFQNQSKTRPTVAFARQTTSTTDPAPASTKGRKVGSAAKASEPSKKPKKKKEQSRKKTKVPTDLGPSLEYLRRWQSDRATWKFNKNCQSLLIKYVFDDGKIPSSDIDTFLEYIGDLKGFSRTRLRETAMEVRDRDIAARASGFPDGTMDIDDKQMEYESVISSFQPQGMRGSKRKSFSESEYMEGRSDGVIARRVVKRMRAEIIISALEEKDGEEGGEGEDKSLAEGSAAQSNGNAGGEEADAKRVKLNDGRKAPRKRKLRVNDDSSSSDSSSDGDDESEEVDNSDEDASSSSSDDSDDEGEEDAPPGEYETSSSSSSSSDYETEEESDEGGGAEVES